MSIRFPKWPIAALAIVATIAAPAVRAEQDVRSCEEAFAEAA